MRIQCPTTDGYFEIPDGLTDAACPCPACGKTHQVTIIVTTVPQEENSGGDDLFSRQTEIAVRPDDADTDRSGRDGSEAAAEIDDTQIEFIVEELAALPEDLRRPAGALPPEAEAAAAAAYAAAENPYERRFEPRRRSRAVPVLFVLLILAAAGFLGWQQYLYEQKRQAAADSLSQADRAWSTGGTAAAAARAEDAAAALKQGEELLTAKNLYNRAAAGTGWFEPLEAETGEEHRRIETHLARDRALSRFRRELSPENPQEMAALLRDASSPDGGRPELALPMQIAVMEESLRFVETAAGADPAAAAAAIQAARTAVAPLLPEEMAAEFAARLDEFSELQRESMLLQLAEEAAAAAAASAAGEAGALARHRELEEKLAAVRPAVSLDDILQQLPEADRPAAEQLARLSEIVDAARRSARSVLARPEGDETEIDALQLRAEEDTEPSAAAAAAAVAMIDEMRAQADDLLRLRMEVYGRMQSEMRRGRQHAGTRLAWAMLRTAFDDTAFAIDPESFRFDSQSARMQFTLRGLPASMAMNEDDLETRIRASAGGYSFTAGWAFMLRKPLMWMADLAEAMQSAGVPADLHPEWELLEGPGGPMALGIPAAAPEGTALRHVFFDGRLLPVTELPHPESEQAVIEDFRQAAMQLHDTVMAEESIPQQLRQALKPVLMGTYQQPDARDYFDSAFCRRLIEADYLETYIDPMPEPVQRDLARYREILDQLEAGYDDFLVELGEGSRLTAVARLDSGFSGDGKASDQDPETGESLPRYVWRIEEDDSTVFYSPMPSRFVYAFMTAERYAGRHTVRPAGVPDSTEVWHTGRGFIASYTRGADRAEGDADLWNLAIAEDMAGRYDPTMGPPGWNFPLHVLERDDQGDPVTLATLSGTVKSPDFSDITDDAARRQAEDAWLDSTAATLSEPGELGLIFHQFFRYCSDSPLPEMPNLIGSHYGLSDTHQTVYESLERRWVGRLIGDCDDLAEFFQVLTRRQGKLSHVMQLPGHAAAGYAEETEDGDYRFVVLQTGPVMQFTAPTLNEVVEIAYRSFDRGEGVSHLTTDAVPLLLRFADEETRTPFVLSARIYADAEYAEKMIEVQSYWHEHVYSAAVAAMEEMVAEDPEIGSIKELGSLYERVGFYDKSAEMRYRELEMVSGQPQAQLSTLLEIVQLYMQEKNRDKAREALLRMEEVMQEMIRNDDAPEFFRSMTFRSFWAIYMTRLGLPAQAWELVKYDAVMTKRQLGRIADPVLRTLVIMYDRLGMMRDAGETLDDGARRAMTEIRRELDEAFGRGYFKADDSYNTIISRYFILGRFAVADVGRDDGLLRLRADGPYPDGPKDQTRRSRSLSEEDWNWLRITPQLYLALAMEMLDQEEYPELYDPMAAKPILEDVSRAVERGTGLGSDVAGGDDVIKADLALAFLDNDLAAFRRVMMVVKEKNYASLYDDAAMTFGLHGGLIPLSEFPDWIEVFREFFPGSQHYFKVVYRAIDKEQYDHALLMAEATARFFPEKELLAREAAFVRSIIPGLKERWEERMRGDAETEEREEAAPAA